jgi:ribose transport system ATP-binding protein/L-arabinose transport system ATP-binding protein
MGGCLGIPSLDEERFALGELRDVSRWFGQIAAVKNVSLRFEEGVIHGLVGANGAGKSTIAKLLGGVIQPTDGEIRIKGKAVRLRDPQQAERLGISVVYQELNLVPTMSALENAIIGTLAASRPGALTPRSRRRHRAELLPFLERLGTSFSLDTMTRDLSSGQQRVLLIARALREGSRLLVLDEPTSSLAAEELGHLYEVIGQLRSEGVSVLFISHRLSEVVQLCDEVTVLRGGEVVVQASRGRFTERDLIAALTGVSSQGTTSPVSRDGTAVAPAELPARATRAGRPLLELVDVYDKGVVRGVSLSLWPGEVLGIGGLVGSGRSELLQTIVGARHMVSGTLRINGARFVFASPAKALLAGIGLLPEERRAQGLMLDESVAFNISLALLSVHRRNGIRKLIVDRRGIGEIVAAIARSVQLRPLRTDIKTRLLSGGNQQKVVLARYLALRGALSVLLLDEPTRGVDVGAREEIHALMRDFARAGGGIIVVASELAELEALCSRVVVIRDGQVRGELTGRDVSEVRILETCFAARA